MFCENCGQQLSDTAKFCSRCGTRQIPFSTEGTTKYETINMNGKHTFIPAKCPTCGSQMKVDTTKKMASCEACGTECLVQDAINTLHVKGNVQVENATINVNETNLDSLLKRVEIMLADGDFSGALAKCDSILDSCPTNALVYFYMLMADVKCKHRMDLQNQSQCLFLSKYYDKIMEYGSSDLKAELENYNAIIVKRITDNNQKRLADAKEHLINPKTGDVVSFGTRKLTQTKSEPIMWKVLDVREGMAFIICNRLFYWEEPYYKGPAHTCTWKESTLRASLNSDFISTHFSPEEAARILPCKVINENNPIYGTKGGEPTIDKVFSLSIQEAQYFNLPQIIDCPGYDCWWLRSPGSDSEHAAYVTKAGRINIEGNLIHDGEHAVGDFGARPVMWIRTGM